MKLKFRKEKAKKFYNQEAENYKKMYTKNYEKYPANLIRLNLIIKRLHELHCRHILDVGCGTCIPMIKLLKQGFMVKGFDFSEDMIKIGKQELKNENFNPNLILKADLENEKTLPKEKFDAILALGVFPHILNEFKALNNIKNRLKKNGRTLIEFRNELFSLFSMNKFSIDFYLNKLIDVDRLPKKTKPEIISFLSDRFKEEKPTIRKDGKISYNEILARFRNPMTIEAELFEPAGLQIEKIHFYHYHALMPIFEKKYPLLFRKLSLKREKTTDWRGYFMASAYVVEAKPN